MNAPVNVVDFDVAQHVTSSWRHRLAAILGSVRFQLLAALIIGIGTPLWIRQQFEYVSDDNFSYETTLIGCAVAVLFGYLIYRKVTSLPGTSALLNQLPGFVVSYLAVLSLFVALRLDFSRKQLVLSFLLVTAFFFVLTYVLSRVRRPVYGLVSGGRTSVLTRIGYVDWVRFSTPAEAERAPHIPLVADFHYAGLTAEWERYLAEAAISGRRVFNAKQLKESIEGQVAIDHLSENSFGHLAPDSIYAPAKFYVDFALAFVAAVLLSPLLLLVALLIRIESRGPALFRQPRMGHRGKPFTVYKFRSMRVQAEAERDVTQDMTQSDDARITRIGKIIRKTRIDELPQIFNILRGEMSWIGPRPETIALSSWYERQLPFYRYRHIVRPGITGWAQIKQGHVTSVDDVREKLEYDFYYVRNFSVWLDVLIVMQTIRVMITGHGAK
ncbi:exopolysaccharide biosynthesis polyprenyl glycosylphosphotransferase [Hyphomonas sp.]|uniref:exopolysaccharide biosynthesis polyprenyl glycosylphosphotransferase n=1 Tax=Hyphomonas sp. TaxID=87 RepID=UPI0025BCEF48|nr:exopolysaccharide biosynthesis polyprenyl glycosylphosphotransferase [Hyphomonas sp.]MBI1399422.1 exopolysaccharide biosynthesis polyprenyl glycosylphosphotransferase [Hyphomonas sp.]